MRHFTVTLAVWTLVAVVGTGAVVGNAPAKETTTPADAIVGTWRGTSICTPVRPACHDEISADHIARSTKPDTVLMTMNKVVDGKEVEMGGTVEFHVDYASRTLTWELAARDGSRGEVRFTWSGKKMTGTMIQLPGREVVRNITLEKQ